MISQYSAIDQYIQARTQKSTLYLGVYSGVTVPLDPYSSVELALGGIQHLYWKERRSNSDKMYHNEGHPL